jgi:solute carrier family 35 protein E3
MGDDYDGTLYQSIRIPRSYMQPSANLISQSGLFASLINMSQFFIIAQTGPVSSTVVGHVKTCSIVALGWATSGRAVGDKSVLGVFVAIGGIIA